FLSCCQSRAKGLAPPPNHQLDPADAFLSKPFVHNVDGRCTGCDNDLLQCATGREARPALRVTAMKQPGAASAMVRSRRLELPRVAPQRPQRCASTSSATTARKPAPCSKSTPGLPREQRAPGLAPALEKLNRTLMFLSGLPGRKRPEVSALSG